MKKRKKKRRRRPRRLGLLGLRQPAQPTSPALHISSPLAHARAVAGRPQLTHSSPACGPATPARPQLACGRCHLAPRVSRALFTRAPLFPSPAAAANRPHSSAFSLFIFSTPTPILPSDRTPIALAGSGPGGHAWGMALPPPLRRAHATPHGRWMQARAPIALESPTTDHRAHRFPLSYKSLDRVP